MHPSEASRVHDRGAAVDVAKLPQLDLIEVGSGPLRLPFYGFGGVPFFPAPRGPEAETTVGPFKDVSTGEPCEPSMFADRTWRCVPSSFMSIIDFELLYESEDCTGARAYNVSTTCVADRPAPRGVVVQSFSSFVDCRHPVIDVIGFDGRSTATAVSRRGLATAACERVPLSTNDRLFRATKALNPAEVFVALDREVKD
jgi:hypothetical protein